jgi:hypothetical protein
MLSGDPQASPYLRDLQTNYAWVNAAPAREARATAYAEFVERIYSTAPPWWCAYAARLRAHRPTMWPG